MSLLPGFVPSAASDCQFPRLLSNAFIAGLADLFSCLHLYCSCLYRAHFGGGLGGALVALLLDPCVSNYAVPMGTDTAPIASQKKEHGRKTSPKKWVERLGPEGRTRWCNEAADSESEH